MTNMLSYPPNFRGQTGVPSSPAHHQSFPTTTDDDIPIIDMQHLDTTLLHSACRDWGVFRVINHGIHTDELMNCTRRLFELPFETKRNLCCSSNEEDGENKVLAYFWGTPVLTPSGEVVPQGPRAIDWVEGFNGLIGELRRRRKEVANGGDVNTDDPVQIIKDFSNLLTDYGDQVTRLAKTLFKSMTNNLQSPSPNSPHSDLPNYLDESTGLLRIYRYPPLINIDNNNHHDSSDNHHAAAKGLEPHTDSSVISILNQDQVGGLEFLKSSSSGISNQTDNDDDDDNWVQVKPIPGSLVVNLGDMMQAMSGDQYRSVRHRVSLDGNRERFSVCYFVFPEENACVTTAMSGLGESKYRDFTYKEFREQVQRDVGMTGKKTGLQPFRRSGSQ